jgi:hypothetical protein
VAAQDPVVAAPRVDAVLPVPADDAVVAEALLDDQVVASLP